MQPQRRFVLDSTRRIHHPRRQPPPRNLLKPNLPSLRIDVLPTLPIRLHRIRMSLSRPLGNERLSPLTPIRINPPSQPSLPLSLFLVPHPHRRPIRLLDGPSPQVLHIRHRAAPSVVVDVRLFNVLGHWTPAHTACPPRYPA